MMSVSRSLSHNCRTDAGLSSVTSKEGSETGCDDPVSPRRNTADIAVSSSDAKLTRLKRQLEFKEKTIKMLNAELQNQYSTTVTLRSDVEKKDGLLLYLKCELEEKKSTISSLQHDLRESRDAFFSLKTEQNAYKLQQQHQDALSGAAGVHGGLGTGGDTPAVTSRAALRQARRSRRDSGLPLVLTEPISPCSDVVDSCQDGGVHADQQPGTDDTAPPSDQHQQQIEMMRRQLQAKDDAIGALRTLLRGVKQQLSALNADNKITQGTSHAILGFLWGTVLC